MEGENLNNLLPTEYVDQDAHERPDSTLQLGEKGTKYPLKYPISAEVGKGLSERQNLLAKMTPILDQYRNLSVNLNEMLNYGPDQVLQLVTDKKSGQFKTGEVLTFNFKDKTSNQINKSLEHGVGLRILPVEVRAVSVKNSDGVLIRGTRKGIAGNFYNPETGKYVPIYDEGKVTIEASPTQTHSPAHLLAQRDKEIAMWQSNSEFYKATSSFPSDERAAIIKVSVESGLDPFLLLAIRAGNSGHYGHENQEGFRSEVELAGKYLQTALEKYKTELKKDPLSGGNYTSECAAYLLNHYNLFADESSGDPSMIQNVLVSYGELKNLDPNYANYPSVVKAKVETDTTPTVVPPVHSIDRLRPSEGPNTEGLKIIDQLSPYKGLIEKYSKLNNIPVELTQAIMMTETGGKNLTSPAGAQGLMQIMPALASQYQVSNPFNPEENIGAGTRYLGYLLNKLYNGRMDLAILAYNGGPGAVENYLLGRRLKRGEKLTPNMYEGHYVNLQAIIKERTEKAKAEGRKPKLENPNYGIKVRKLLGQLGYDISSIRYE